jgi:hypothetical protein
MAVVQLSARGASRARVASTSTVAAPATSSVTTKAEASTARAGYPRAVRAADTTREAMRSPADSTTSRAVGVHSPVRRMP